MDFKFQFPKVRISTKLLLLNLMIWGSFLLILCVVVIAFHGIRQTVSKVTESEMGRAIANSRRARDVSLLYADIELLRNRFYGNDAYLASTGSQLVDTMGRIVKGTADQDIKRTLLIFQSHFRALLGQCATVNGILQAKETVDHQLDIELVKFENMIADLFVTYTLEGEETDFVEQILTLVIGYRESLLQIGKLYAELGPEHYFIPREGKSSPLILLIDDLTLRLQTITASIPEIAQYGEKISGFVQEYRAIILDYYRAMEKLGERMTAIDRDKAMLLTAMEQVEKSVTNATQEVSRNIERKVTFAAIIVIAVSLLVLIVVGLTTTLLFRSTISNPMQKILRGIQTLKKDGFDKAIELGRKDEWDKIEKGLNRMAADLKNSYNTLKQRELFLTAIIENIPNMIFVKDAEDLRFVRFNKAGEELLGFDRQDLIGKNDYDFFPKEEADFFTEKDRTVLIEGSLLDIPEEPIMTKYKGQRILHTKKIPLLGPNGEAEYLLGISEDITEIKQVEEQQRLQSQIMDQIHDSVIAVDLDGMVTSWNKGSENLFQYKNDEAIGRHISFIYPVESHEMLRNEIIPGLLSHNKLEMETTLFRKDGKVFDSLVSLSVLRDRNNEINGMIGYTIDISDRKQIERELRESEAKFRTLFDVAAIPLGYVDSTGAIIDINSKFTQVFGYTISDIPTLEEWWVVAYPDPEYRKMVIDVWETAVKKAEKENTDIEPVEFQVTCKNGEIRSVIISGNIIQDNLLATFIDITERKRAEEAERRSNVLYREITTQSGEGISISDIEGNYVSVNPAFCSMTGYGESELLEMNVKELVPSETKMTLFPQVIKGKQGQRITELEKNDGSRFIAEINGYPIDLEDQKLILGTVRDITERIQAEEKIKASLKEKEILLREIHHRVKNNLAVIISLLNLQAHQIRDERIAEALRDSCDRVKSMALIHETLYRTESFSDIGLEMYVKNLCNRLNQVIKSKDDHVRMMFKIEDIRLGIDQAIPCGLILNELVTNALKYAFPDGRGKIRISADYSGSEEIELVVHDNGIGLPEELEISKLESFGLGIVAILTENQLDGTLDIRNENGARFSIRWPVANDNGKGKVNA